MGLWLVIVVYVVSLIIANLVVSVFGPAFIGITAFVMIGLDLALRDWLHFKLAFKQMGGLIILSGGLTYALNPNAATVAIASAVAFTVAAFADWITFTLLRGSWLFRANGSNVSGAITDSILFPLLAFGQIMPEMFWQQFIAKVLGGTLWATLIVRLHQMKKH